MDWGAGHLTIKERRAGLLSIKSCPQGRAFEQFFSNARGMPGGGGMLAGVAAGIDSHLGGTFLL